ncbi:hypothetical protein [Aureibaculum luteum]|uniref:hypothetical protein n=1 Tax=Aureibaculum luteum TaxID=1548456 RepID=UPI0018E4E368|nr:hypothetical protein [Aureibaculum luteum]
MNLLTIVQQLDIEKKLKDAPDGGYEIGILIGTYLPFAVLVVIAYIMYHRAKKKKRF